VAITDTTTQYGRFAIADDAVDRWLGGACMAGLVAVPILGTVSALLFLVAGIALCLRKTADTVPAILRHWPLLILPTFCVLSTLWSRQPPETFRFALQLGATLVIAIALAHRVPARTLIQALFAILGTAVLASVALGASRGDGALLGLYGSKNAMAGAAALFGVLAVGVALDPVTPRLLRLCAAFGVCIAPVIVLTSQSVSALAVMPIGIVAMLSALALRRLPPLGRVALLAGLALLTVLAALVAVTATEQIAATFLDVTGKDMTLTGRTELWRIALGFIAERPLLGIGYQAFWLKGHAPAEALWLIFGIDARSGFNFHNTYLSNAVEIGILGALIQAALVTAAVILPLRVVLKTGDRIFALLFGLAVMLFVTTLGEVPIFFQFSLRSVLVIVTIVASLAALRQVTRRPTGSAPHTPERTGPRRSTPDRSPPQSAHQN